MQEVGGNHRNTYRLRGGNDLTVWPRLCGTSLTLICIPVKKNLTPVFCSFLCFFLSLAVSHNRHFRLWEEGAPASAGVQNFAELGVTQELMKAAKEARRRRTVGAMYRTAGIPNGIGHSSTELLMHPRSSLVIETFPNAHTHAQTQQVIHTVCLTESIESSADPGRPIMSSIRSNTSPLLSTIQSDYV